MVERTTAWEEEEYLTLLEPLRHGKGCSGACPRRDHELASAPADSWALALSAAQNSSCVKGRNPASRQGSREIVTFGLQGQHSCAIAHSSMLVRAWQARQREGSGLG